MLLELFENFLTMLVDEIYELDQYVLNSHHDGWFGFEDFLHIIEKDCHDLGDRERGNWQGLRLLVYFLQLFSFSFEERRLNSSNWSILLKLYIIFLLIDER